MKNFKYAVMLLILNLLLVNPCLALDNPFLDLAKGTRLYFSHIATTDNWETEIAVLNPTSQAVQGTLSSFDEDGKQVGSEVSIDLPAHGRYQVDVASTFSGAEKIAYMLLSSATYGLKGYSKFYNYKMGVRASIVSSTPQKSGLFTKLDHEGWTGIAFVNTSTAVAHVKLTAYNNQGESVAVENIDLNPGAKEVKQAILLFSKSIAGASYVEYLSDQKVVGFFLNGSEDGTMLDGSKAL